MPIEFNIPDLSDEQKAFLQSDAVQQYVQNVINTHVETAKQAFKTKMDALGSKVKAFEGVNPDDLPLMKAALEKNTELSGMVSQWKEKAEQREAALKERESRLEALEFNQSMAQNIDKYGAVAGAYQIQSGASELLVQVAKQRAKKTEDGKVFYTKTDGSPLMSDTGYADGVKFIESLRAEYPFMFGAPTGSGASGSKHSGSANKQFSDMNEQERVALFRENPSEYNRLKALK